MKSSQLRCEQTVAFLSLLKRCRCSRKQLLQTLCVRVSELARALHYKALLTLLKLLCNVLVKASLACLPCWRTETLACELLCTKLPRKRAINCTVCAHYRAHVRIGSFILRTCAQNYQCSAPAALHSLVHTLLSPPNLTRWMCQSHSSARRTTHASIISKQACPPD